MRSRLRALILGWGLIIAAPAFPQEDNAPPSHHHGWHGGGMFVSPCGKPYRADPGEPYPVAAWFAEADTNHDGSLDKAELRADAKAFFVLLDRNHDGVIDPQEVTFYEQNIVPEILRRPPSPQASAAPRFILVQFGGGMGGGGMGGGGGGHHGHHGSQSPSGASPSPESEMTGLAPYNLLAEPEPVTAADANFDGEITLAEFLAAADRHFDALDVNHAGHIALADLPKTAVQSRMHGPHPGGSNNESRPAGTM